MLRKFSLGAAAVAAAGASIALGVPNAIAAPAAVPVFAGVYPNEGALANACDDGYRQGRWYVCFSCPETAGQRDLWVGTAREDAFAKPPKDCRNIGVPPTR